MGLPEAEEHGSLSSCEAEIVAASEAAKEAIYLSNFLNELGEMVPSPMPLSVTPP